MAASDAEIGRLRSELQPVKAEAAEAVSRAKDRKFVKSGLKDFSKIYPKPFTKVVQWKTFEDDVLRCVGVGDPSMAASMRAAVKKKVPHSHTHGRDATFLYAHVRGWVPEADGAKIVYHIDDNDGIECWKKLARRFNPQTALTKGARLRGITPFAEKHTAKKNA